MGGAKEELEEGNEETELRRELGAPIFATFHHPPWVVERVILVKPSPSPSPSPSPIACRPSPTSKFYWQIGIPRSQLVSREAAQPNILPCVLGGVVSS